MSSNLTAVIIEILFSFVLHCISTIVLRFLEPGNRDGRGRGLAPRGDRAVEVRERPAVAAPARQDLAARRRVLGDDAVDRLLLSHAAAAVVCTP